MVISQANSQCALWIIFLSSIFVCMSVSLCFNPSYVMNVSSILFFQLLGSMTTVPLIDWVWTWNGSRVNSILYIQIFNILDWSNKKITFRSCNLISQNNLQHKIKCLMSVIFVFCTNFESPIFLKTWVNFDFVGVGSWVRKGNHGLKRKDGVLPF